MHHLGMRVRPAAIALIVMLGVAVGGCGSSPVRHPAAVPTFPAPRTSVEVHWGGGFSGHQYDTMVIRLESRTYERTAAMRRDQAPLRERWLLDRACILGLFSRIAKTQIGRATPAFMDEVLGTVRIDGKDATQLHEPTGVRVVDSLVRKAALDCRVRP